MVGIADFLLPGGTPLKDNSYSFLHYGLERHDLILESNPRHTMDVFLVIYVLVGCHKYGKTRVTGYVLLATSWKLKSQIWNSKIQSSNSRVAISNARVTTSYPWVTSSSLRVTSSNPRVLESFNQWKLKTLNLKSAGNSW